MINHCDRRITHLSDTDVSFVLFNISSKFLSYLECYSLSPKKHKKVSKQIKQSKTYISITKKSDMSITVIYHAMSLTVPQINPFSVVNCFRLFVSCNKISPYFDQFIVQRLWYDSEIMYMCVKGIDFASVSTFQQ